MTRGVNHQDGEMWVSSHITECASEKAAHIEFDHERIEVESEAGQRH